MSKASAGIEEIEVMLKSLLGGDNTSIYIEYNEHKGDYKTASEWVEEQDEDSLKEWVSKEQRDKAVQNDTVWRIQWYPDTPIGFYVLYAADLAPLIEKALTVSRNAD